MNYIEDEFHGLLPFDRDTIAQAYLKYLQQGKLPSSNCPAKKILIIGCGVAGMVSASMLKKAGHDVTIVEANTRVGGRCKTFRNTPEKQFFEDSNLTGEAGAMRIPDMHKLVQHLIDYTGVDKQLFLNKTISKADATSGKIEHPERDEQGNIKLPPATGNNFLHFNYQHVLRGTEDQQGTYEYKDADVNSLINQNTVSGLIIANSIKL